MKVLIFTHRSDIDGMGGAVLAKLAFSNVDYVLSETFNLHNEINKYLHSGKIYQYDKIFVTDLWVDEPLLSTLANDNKLKGKFWVFDHHESVLKGDFDKYTFTTIKIKNEIGLCSGTSLFYEYLCDNGYLDKSNKAIYEFSELTRKYDTWEWKTIYNEEKAHELALLFYAVGGDAYIELMFQKLKNDIDYFGFSDLENMLISNKKNQIREQVVNYTNKIIYKDMFGLKAGIVFIAYEYRNDLVEYIRVLNLDIDFIMMIAADYGTISYRPVRDDVNVREIAEKLGGKGHDKAASSPISEKQKTALVEILTKSCIN